jgi:hypothetical protein
MPRPVDSGRPSELSPNRVRCVDFCVVNHIVICIIAVHGAVPDFRNDGVPCGLFSTLCTLRQGCSFPCRKLRASRNTRYRWLAKPFRVGPCTLPDVPSFSWRANARRNRRKKAAATEPQRTAIHFSRRLFASGSRHR